MRLAPSLQFLVGVAPGATLNACLGRSAHSRRRPVEYL